jgi:hypothetical protein
MPFRFFTNHPRLKKCAACGATYCALHGPFVYIGDMKLECPTVSEQECASVRLYGAQSELHGRGLLLVSTSASSAIFQTSTQPST